MLKKLQTFTICASIAATTVKTSASNPVDYSTLLSEREKKVASCELSALQLGTKMADIFNAPIGDEDWKVRVHQDAITESLGFAPWMAHGLQNGMTTDGSNAKELHEKNGWSGRKIGDSPYAFLNHKWIYMLGDSTTRQLWASFAAPFQGNNFERNSKEWTRQYCNKQEHRIHHPKGGTFSHEGWKGPCGLNEVTCHVSGYGEGGLLTLDWKHFPWEDYDEWLWSDKGPWLSGFNGEGGRRPDVLTIQMGLHSCWHTHPDGLYSSDLHEVNQTMLNSHLDDVTKLMIAVKRATIGQQLSQVSSGSASKNASETMVIFVTSGSTGATNGALMDECILRFNRVVANAAHAMGFIVLERGEIERRLMFKSIMNNVPYLAMEMHLAQPAQNIVATCLLHLMNCLQASSSLIFNSSLLALYNETMYPSHSFEGKHREGPRKSKSKSPPARPLHSPP